MESCGASADRLYFCRLTKLVPISCVAMLVALSGCSIYQPPPQDGLASRYRDRCYIEDEHYLLADRLYATLGTLGLTERHLREELQWRDCEVQEALYRLSKVHGLP
jgi:hypothetical protein